MPATATETKTRKPPKLFSVTGDHTGIKTELSKTARDTLTDAVTVLYALSKAGETFPRALSLSAQLQDFAEKPTAKPETPKA